MNILTLLLLPLTRQLRHMQLTLENRMSALDDALARVQSSTAANLSATNAAIQAINDLKAQVAAGGFDPTATVAALGAIADQLDANNGGLNAAVAPAAAPAPSAPSA
jgi:hypothetical protein